MNNESAVGGIDRLVELVRSSLDSGQFVKLVLSRYNGPESSLQRVILRRVTIQGGDQISFCYRHEKRDVFKNLPIPGALTAIRAMLGDSFHGADLFTTGHDYRLLPSRRGESRLVTCKPSCKEVPATGHNRVHSTAVDSKRPFLRELGVTDAHGNVLPKMQGKWNQINKFIEIAGRLIGEAHLKRRDVLRVVDMGCGRGYLTFALHDYIQNNLGLRAEVRGIEQREDLVRETNSVIGALGLKGLKFEQGGIIDAVPGEVDLLIALHACDTATDDAIAKGVQAGAPVIVCAPCCHKELRHKMKVPDVLSGILRHGILMERQAELLTDGLRAMRLEREGYRAEVFEFVSPEHTGKNLIITAVRVGRNTPDARNEAAIKAVEQFFGLIPGQNAVSGTPQC